MAAIVNAIHKSDLLAVLSYVFQYFVSLFITRRGQNEPFNNCESRFQVLISKLHSHGTEAKLFDAVLAFNLLANADVVSPQRMSVLENSAPRTESFKDTDKTDEFLKKVSYDAIASVLRQLEKTLSSLS